MISFIKSILERNETHISQGEIEAICQRVIDHHFSNEAIEIEIRNANGWYNKYTVYLACLICYKDHLLFCIDRGLEHDPKPNFVQMREQIEILGKTDSYKKLIDIIRDLLNKVEHLESIINAAINDCKSKSETIKMDHTLLAEKEETIQQLRLDKRDLKEEIEELKEEIRRLKKQNNKPLSYRDRSIEILGEEKYQKAYDSWLNIIHNPEEVDQLIFHLCNAKNTPEAINNIIFPLLSKYEEEFRYVESEDIADFVKLCITFKAGASLSNIKKNVYYIRPAKK